MIIGDSANTRRQRTPRVRLVCISRLRRGVAGADRSTKHVAILSQEV